MNKSKIFEKYEEKMDTLYTCYYYSKRCGFQKAMKDYNEQLQAVRIFTQELLGERWRQRIYHADMEIDFRIRPFGNKP
ncbi:MAG: hypothetical protein CME84_16125 [Henriciella sp.]|nr:hypothetical protein [Henriciella sp.]